MDLARFPRRRYTHAPTPIELLPHFTKALAASCPGGVGPEIWIKRDDLLGLFFRRLQGRVSPEQVFSHHDAQRLVIFGF